MKNKIEAFVAGEDIKKGDIVAVDKKSGLLRLARPGDPELDFGDKILVIIKQFFYNAFK